MSFAAQPKIAIKMSIRPTARSGNAFTRFAAQPKSKCAINKLNSQINQPSTFMSRNDVVHRSTVYTKATIDDRFDANREWPDESDFVIE